MRWCNRKNLRKDAEDYTATTPPHVVAARKSKQARESPAGFSWHRYGLPSQTTLRIDVEQRGRRRIAEAALRTNVLLNRARIRRDLCSPAAAGIVRPRSIEGSDAGCLRIV